MAFLLWAFVMFCAAEDPRGPGEHSAELVHGGITRSYSYRLPPSYAPGSSLPVVFVLAGGRKGGAGMKVITDGGFEPLADKEGFILVYPEYVGNIWNDGRNVRTYPSHAKNVDDVGFLSKLMDVFVKDFGADRRRLYVAGYSNGGMMAQRAACELSSRVAAAASVAGAMPSNVARRCRLSRPVPMLMVHGREDYFVSWDEGYVTIAGNKVGRRLTVPSMVRFWTTADGCPKKPAERLLPDAAPEDGTRIRESVWGPCRQGAEVRLYDVEGGGHTWPNGGEWQPEFISGRISRDLDACAVIWGFFRSLPAKRKRS
ncbi:MAG: PHB depolymerase family esterase [Elusimicrobiota bacterium]